MRTLVRYAAVVVTAALPCVALAAHRAPGQWEITSTMRFSQGGPQLPPELLAKMRARGVSLPGSGEPHTYKVCLTPEQAAKEDHPDLRQDKACKVTNTAWSGNHFHSEISCNGNGNERHGVTDGDVSDGSKRVVGTIRMEGQNPHMGGHYVMEGHTTGRWIGPTCSKEAP